MMKAQTDTELINQAQAGDQNALSALVERYKDVVYRVCLRVLRQVQSAEDASQNAFHKAIQNLDACLDADMFKPWLLKIAYNCAVDIWRRDQREREKAVKTMNTPELHGKNVTPEAMLHALNEEVDQLPYEERIAVTLHYLENMSQREVGTVLNCSHGTVKTRIKKALQQMNEHLTASGFACSVLALEGAMPNLPLAQATAKLSSALGSLVSSNAIAASVVKTTLVNTALTTGDTLMKVKLITAATVLTLVGFGSGMLVQPLTRGAAESTETTKETQAKSNLDLNRLRSENESLSRKMQGQQLDWTRQKQQLQVRINNQDQEIIALSASNQACQQQIARLKQQASTTPDPNALALQIPENITDKTFADLQPFLAQLKAMGADALPIIKDLLAQNIDVVFKAEFSPDKEQTFLHNTPSLRFSLIMLLGDIGSKEALHTMRTLVQESGSMLETYAVAFVLTKTGRSLDKDLPWMVDITKRHLIQEAGQASERMKQQMEMYDKYQQDLEAALPEDLRKIYDDIEAQTITWNDVDSETMTEIDNFNAIFWDKWYEINEKQFKTEGITVDDLEKIIQVFGPMQMIPELKQYILAGGAQSSRFVEMIGIKMPPSEALAILKELYHEFSGDENQQYGYWVLEAMGPIMTRESFDFIYSVYPDVKSKYWSYIHQGIRTGLNAVGNGTGSRNPFTFEYKKAPRSLAQVRMAIQFLEDLIPISPGKDQWGRNYEDQLRSAIKDAKERHRVK
ncbi:sigma-70 family RNA polymerase sigma factor [Planctomycetota bacterium]